MNTLSDIEILVSVVTLGSYTDAARSLGISKSYASKQVRALEDRLGVKLLHRTTRNVTPTDAGRAYVERCAALLEDLRQAEQEVTAMQEAPRGSLRLSVPVSYGVRHVAPSLARFMALHPALRVSVDLSDRRVDLIEEGYDLAIRIGRLQDSSHLARKIAPVRGVVVASPAYVRAHGALKRPEDLREHRCLTYSLHASPSHWALHSSDDANGEPVRVKVQEVMTSNNGDALLEAALASVGIASLPNFFVDRAIEDGLLLEVLPRWNTLAGAGVWAIYPAGRFIPAKVRFLIEHLLEDLGGASPTS
jgi:DNA-binding transcriptional LysR family regulator